MGLLTDLRELHRLGTEKAGENIAFRRFLSAHHLGEEHFRILAGEVQKDTDCTACANCCRHSIVPVDKLEVEAIARHIATTPEAVAHLYTAPDPDALSSRILLNQGGCVFLSGNLCMVYEARPKTCRDFPHIAAGSHSLGGRTTSHARWAALCPIIYNALERYKVLTGYHPRQRH